jgi:S1-C subfamily serine protease
VLAAILGGAIVLTAFALGRVTGNSPATTTSLAAAATAATQSTVATTGPETTTSSTTSTTKAATTSTTETTVTAPDDPVAAVADGASKSVVRIETRTGYGSGIIYDSAGYVLTAAHVVEGNDDLVTVRLADGRELDGTVIGRYEPSDIAVISIPDSGDLPQAELDRGADVTVGQLAIALGSPFGFEQTVTAGIVSAVDRLIDGTAMIQTDAAINPGNSGGPLLDAAGRVIGINDVIFTTTGGSDGVGFAISIDVASIVADQIIAGTDVHFAYLGVTVSDETGDTPGAAVDRVAPHSPAADAGLLRGDIIVSMDGNTVNRGDVLRSRIIRHRPGDTVDITAVRDGALQVFSVALGTTDK